PSARPGNRLRDIDGKSGRDPTGLPETRGRATATAGDVTFLDVGGPEGVDQPVAVVHAAGLRPRDGLELVAQCALADDLHLAHAGPDVQVGVVDVQGCRPAHVLVVLGGVGLHP